MLENAGTVSLHPSPKGIIGNKLLMSQFLRGPLAGRMAPVGGHQNNRGHGFVSAELTEETHVRMRRASDARNVDAMEVHNARHLDVLRIGYVEPVDDLAQDFGVGPQCVVETRGVDKYDSSVTDGMGRHMRLDLAGCWVGRRNLLDPASWEEKRWKQKRVKYRIEGHDLPEPSCKSAI